jgi:hypothetical protein
LDDVQAAMPFHIFLLATSLLSAERICNERFLAGDAVAYRDSPFRSDRRRGRAA